MKILFLSAEVVPFAKRGGLGDVAGALPQAMKKLGHDVRVIMPAYSHIEQAYRDGKWDLQARPEKMIVPMDNIEVGAFEGCLPDTEVPIYFMAQHDLLGRQKVYGYHDDPYRFAFFSRAALQFAVEELDWRPDVVHAHDWHTAPAVLWLATAGSADEQYRGIATVFTIHNLAHQGQTDWDILNHMGVWTHSLEEESYGRVNFMARGIYHATKINTVSPTYAAEITTLEGGAGLHGLLRHRQNDLHGILNGLDYRVWNPQTDARLVSHFEADEAGLEMRLVNKRALQAKLGLPQRDEVPLLAMISRLDWQKGLDLMGEVVHRLMSDFAGEAQFILLGSGETSYEHMFANMAAYHQHKMKTILAYRADLAPLIYGGSDMFLMPSLFEPCGLGQLIAMRYGCVPIVRATGGLVDTVKEPETGFVFHDFNAYAFWEAVARAIYVYNVDKPRWGEIQLAGMRSDVSWPKQAEAYDALYRQAVTG